ncbi:cellulose biosynthesis protein BcsE [Caballeronia sp. Lep1P3]|uniref:cellulose biosynthesis protein BcsE n=1 Tax=Caballeronia sp. Lep1P3 TaxID=2878150 RepID=UPI001FCF810C|nr:cellulose biosynthesis protein BcsE [Caballeronia sp. Lep1P3]
MNRITNVTENDTSPPRAPGVLAALARFVRARIAGREPAHNRLAVDALPDDLATLKPGGLYAVHVAPRSPECDALIWATARAADTRDVTVVLARERAAAAARLRELGFSGTAAHGWPRRLNVLAMPDEAPADDGQPPLALARLFGGLRALRRYRFRPDALYIVEGAQRWFTSGDAAALASEGRVLSSWCETRGITMILLLGPADASANRFADPDVDVDLDDEGPEEGASRFAELNGLCAGVARVRRSHGELLWHVDFWRAGNALITGDRHALRFTDDGRLSVAPAEAVAPAGEAHEAHEAHGRRLARDETRVVVSRAVVGDEAWVPREWEIVENREAAVAACENARGATVVLAHRGGAELEALCAAVHTLRRRCGRALKIAVVERGEVLRHQYELLMLSLGANLVVGRDVPFSRLESLLQSLQGQLYTRPLMPDYRAALAASLADAALGYLNVATFCAHTQTALARGAVLRLPHVLVRMTLPPTLAHVDALGQCRPRRAGDVFTADAAHLFVFLFACRLADADAALARIFAVPVDNIAKDVVYLSNDDIAAELRVLEASNRRAPAADYTDLFTAREEARPSTAPVLKPDRAESTRRARAELDALDAALEREARRDAAIRTEQPSTRRAVPARMPLAKPGN